MREVPVTDPISRRRLIRCALTPAIGQVLGVAPQAQDVAPGTGRLGIVGGRDEKGLFPAKGLPGGGQLEIRLVQSMYTSDADELEVAQRARPYDLDSWHVEWTRVAEKNEEAADAYAAQGFKVSAGEHYRRAQDFY